MWLSVFIFNFVNGAMASFTQPFYSFLVRVSRISNDSDDWVVSFVQPQWIMTLQNKAFNAKYETFSGLVTLCLLLLNFGLLFATLFMIVKHSWTRRKMKKVISAANKSRSVAPKQAAIGNFFTSFAKELKLTIYGMFLLVCFFMSFAYGIIDFVYGGRVEGRVLFPLRIAMLNLSSDIFGVVNPFGLVLMSTPLREKLAEFLILGKSLTSPLGKKMKKGILVFAVLYFCVVAMLIVGVIRLISVCIRRNFYYMYDDISCRKALDCM